MSIILLCIKRWVLTLPQHLLKNVIKNLNRILRFKWLEFIKFFYKYLDEYDESKFLEKWNQLKIMFPLSSKYLIKIDKNLTQ